MQFSVKLLNPTSTQKWPLNQINTPTRELNGLKVTVALSLNYIVVNSGYFGGSASIPENVSFKERMISPSFDEKKLEDLITGGSSLQRSKSADSAKGDFSSEEGGCSTPIADSGDASTTENNTIEFESSPVLCSEGSSTENSYIDYPEDSLERQSRIENQRSAKCTDEANPAGVAKCTDSTERMSMSSYNYAHTSQMIGTWEELGD